jgi:ATP-dependent protease ClpP protease subunit|uniref:Protease n=1 Tax=viral metagenome TaxID=1070528 RepID=A0A6C0LWE7_9ZZZZ
MDHKVMYNFKKRKRTCEDEELEEKEQADDNIYIINNHLYFSSDITPKSAFTLCKYLRSLEIKLKIENISMSSSVKPEIYLHITTNGGCIYSAFSIIDCFESLSIPVNTVIDSNVSSAGTIISIHGNKRYICNNSYVLIHELRSGCWGKLAYLDDTYKNCLKIQDHINQIYLDKTKITKKYLKEILVKDLELNADECIRLGIADEIYISK